MTCKVCDHTMAKLNLLQKEPNWYWCSRCGTLREVSYDRDSEPTNDDDIPKLVERCRKYEKQANVDVIGWVGFGIAESINTPENRIKE